jgi:formate dehydrogenase subunit gamma
MQAMIRGYVTAGWAWRHHRKWLREEAGDSVGQPQAIIRRAAAE